MAKLKKNYLNTDELYLVPSNAYPEKRIGTKRTV
jgi:hypothetical protein